MSKYRFLATLAAACLGAASFAGYWEIEGPTMYGGWSGTGNGTAWISGEKGCWSYSANAAATKFVPSATASSSVVTIFRWHIIYHGEALASTDAVVSVFGHLYSFADCGDKGTGVTSSHAEGSAGSSWLGLIQQSSASGSTSGGSMHDLDGSTTDHAYSAIPFDDASGTAIPLVDNEGYINVPINGMTTGLASYTGTGVLPASGGGDVYGEVELINVGGQSVEILPDEIDFVQDWVAGLFKDSAPIAEIPASMLLDPWITETRLPKV